MHQSPKPTKQPANGKIPPRVPTNLKPPLEKSMGPCRQRTDVADMVDYGSRYTSRVQRTRTEVKQKMKISAGLGPTRKQPIQSTGRPLQTAVFDSCLKTECPGLTAPMRNHQLMRTERLSVRTPTLITGTNNMKTGNALTPATNLCSSLDPIAPFLRT